jgi:2,3-bisphosphoglycerate-independent phosphoglycerate mutase
MIAKDIKFASVARAVLAMTPIASRLLSTEAVILERVARGGGVVNWYYCRSQKEMPIIEEFLRPGSVVSFYFDNRIRRSRQSPELRRELEEIITKSGEVVVGFLERDGMRIDAAVVVSSDDLREFISAIDPSTEIFYGLFPDRDNDGIRAVTATLPDNDGIVRPHPH